MLPLLDNPVVDYRAAYGIPPDETIIAFTGRLLIEKGVRKLIEAFSGLQDEKAYLFIAGGGNLLEEIKQKASDKIIVLGQIDFSHIAALLAATDIFCLPTDYPEGFSTSLLEAAMGNCYIIVSRCGGAPELLPTDEYGAILEHNTISEIRAKLSLAIGDRESRKKAVTLTYHHLIDNFTWHSTAKCVINIFEKR
jgi:glycosyltransferase involved in cell wall biosynthesis